MINVVPLLSGSGRPSLPHSLPHPLPTVSASACSVNLEVINSGAKTRIAAATKSTATEINGLLIKVKSFQRLHYFLHKRAKAGLALPNKMNEAMDMMAMDPDIRALQAKEQRKRR